MNPHRQSLDQLTRGGVIFIHYCLACQIGGVVYLKKTQAFWLKNYYPFGILNPLMDAFSS